MVDAGINEPIDPTTQLVLLPSVQSCLESRQQPTFQLLDTQNLSVDYQEKSLSAATSNSLVVNPFPSRTDSVQSIDSIDPPRIGQSRLAPDVNSLQLPDYITDNKNPISIYEINKWNESRTSSKEQSIEDVSSNAKPRRRKNVRPQSTYGIRYKPAQTFVLNFVFPEPHQTLQMEIVADETISQIKNNLSNHPNLPSDLESLENYRFCFHNTNNELIELFDEQQLL